ncbi:hypothetical protein ACLK1Y_22345 [Escherichia coli]
MSATTKPSRREQRAQAQHFIDTLEGTAFPNSERIYITGSQPDIRIPMREIQLSPTLIGGNKEHPQFEANEAVPVYDTSGPYGDPDVAINVQQGLAKLASRELSLAMTAKNLPCAVPITLKRGWQMMASTNCVLAAY